MVGRKTGDPFVGDVVDFLNPLSDAQDIINLFPEVKWEEGRCYRGERQLGVLPCDSNR